MLTNHRSTTIGAEITQSLTFPWWTLSPRSPLFWVNSLFQLWLQLNSTLDLNLLPLSRAWCLSLQLDGAQRFQQYLSRCQDRCLTTLTCHHLGLCLYNLALEWCSCRARVTYRHRLWWPPIARIRYNSTSSQINPSVWDQFFTWLEPTGWNCDVEEMPIVKSSLLIEIS